MTKPAGDVAQEWFKDNALLFIAWSAMQGLPNKAEARRKIESAIVALIERERLEARMVGLNDMSAVLERHIQERLMVSTIYRWVIAEIRKSEAQLAASKSATPSAGAGVKR